VPSNGRNFQQVVAEVSKDADLVFIGLNIPEPGSERQYANWLRKTATNLDNVIFVRNGSEFAGKLV